MKTILALALGLFLFEGCVMAPLAKEAREFSFVEQTTVKQKDAYNSALAYLAKNLGDSNFAIKVKDPEAGSIITDIALDCPQLKNSVLDPNRHTVLYNLEVQTKDNKIRFIYEATVIRTFNGFGGRAMGEDPVSSQGAADSAKTCAERNKADILSAIASRGSNKEW